MLATVWLWVYLLCGKTTAFSLMAAWSGVALGLLAWHFLPAVVQTIRDQCSAR